MKDFVRTHSLMFASFAFGIWIFMVWRLSGMPSPGFLGRILPGAWILAGVLSGRAELRKQMSLVFVFFTVSTWLWMIFEPGWMLAAAASAAGLVLWGIQTAVRSKYGIVPALVPVLFLVLFTAEVNSDETRFAEISVSITGIPSDQFGEQIFRAGDISSIIGHHTPVFPVLISPGLLAGDWGLRIIPVLITFAAVLLLAKVAGPSAAAAAALLYPGFSTLGLAMTGWLAAGLFCATLFMGKGVKPRIFRFLIAVFLAAVKMRYAGLAAGIIIAEYACSRQKRGKWMIPSFVFLGGILLLALDRYILGGELFWIRYGNVEMIRLVWINVFHTPVQSISNAGWSLFDPEAGIFYRAPWAIASLYGLGALRSRSPELFLRTVVPSVLYWVVLIVWSGSSWHGLPAPSGRVFLPMLPMLALGLREVWNRQETKFLLLASAAFSSIALIFPHARANYADGTDAILSLLGAVSGFSMVRSSGFCILLALIPASSLILMMRMKRYSAGLLCLTIFSTALASGLHSSVLEAEDLTGNNVQGALVYPSSPDPVERYFWFISRERMLELSRTDHVIVLQGVNPGDTLLLEASSAGGTLIVGIDTMFIRTELTDLPESFAFVGRRVETLPDRPENREFLVYRLPLFCPEGTASIRFGGGEPVYLDRIGVL